MNRILVGYIVDFNSSGIDKYLINVIKTAYENGIHLDFLTSVYNDSLEQYLKPYDYNVYTISSLKKPLAQYKETKQILQYGNYDAAYFNISEPLNFIGAKAAHDVGVRVMLHSHNSNVNSSSLLKRTIRIIINRICKLFIYKYCDCFFACSRTAGEWMYPKKIVESEKFKVIFNSVDASKFVFEEEIRNSVRENLGISNDTLVLGHVGRCDYAKNNTFLIDIAKELSKMHVNFKMLLLGDGPDLKMVKQKAKNLSVDKYIEFLGIRNDVNRIMQAFDVFLLPSRIEGFPIVAVEAQFIGVPCIFSDAITSEVVLTDNSLRLPIDNAKAWSDEILKRKNFTKISADINEKFSLIYQKNQILNEILL